MLRSAVFLERKRRHLFAELYTFRRTALAQMRKNSGEGQDGAKDGWMLVHGCSQTEERHQEGG